MKNKLNMLLIFLVFLLFSLSCKENVFSNSQNSNKPKLVVVNANARVISNIANNTGMNNSANRNNTVTNAGNALNVNRNR